MTDHRSNIGSSSSRRRIAAVVALIGVAFVGSKLVNVWPRNVEVAYEVGPAVEEVDVDYLQAGVAVASVRFNQPDEKTPVFSHIVRLQPGEYQIHVTLYGQNASVIEEVRKLSVPTAGVTRFDLSDATAQSE